MAFRHQLLPFAMAVVLFASGIAGTLAWQEGLYGTVLFLTLTSIATLLTLLSRIASPVFVVREPPSPRAGEEQAVLFRTIIDQAPTPLLIVEDGGRVRAINRVARRVFDVADRIENPPAAILDRDTDRFQSGERIWRIDRIDAHLAGRYAVIVTLIDIESEERIATFKATKELLQILGHEVMNALAPISSLIESAISTLSVPSRRETALPDILGTLGRRADGLLRLTDSYRVLARIPNPNIGLHSLDVVIADVDRISAVQRTAKATLLTAVHVRHPVKMDRELVTQALGSIVQNAYESSRDSSNVFLEATSDGRRVSILISNDGPEIAETSRHDIFKVFYTTKEHGSGIGLSMARSIAQAHGGDVLLKSNKPVTFEFWLPV